MIKPQFYANQSIGIYPTTRIDPKSELVSPINSNIYGNGETEPNKNLKIPAASFYRMYDSMAEQVMKPL